MNALSIIILSYLYVYSIIILYITYLAKKKRETGAYINNLVNALILIISLTINVILINIFNLYDREFINFPFNILTIAFILFFLPMFYLFIYREKSKIKTNKRRNRYLESQQFTELPLKYDIYRKLSHFVALGIIFFYFTLGFILQNFLIIVEGDIMIFSQSLVVFLVMISLIGLLTADFIRILTPKFYPLKQVNQILREKELHMRLGPHISMSIGCFSIILLFGIIQPIGPIIICTSMAMSIFGDVTANLVGRTIGSRKIRKTNKTYEGLIGGIIAAFLSGVIVLLILRNYYRFSILGLLLIPFIGILIIGIIDYLDLEIDDNLTFNFCVSTILFFCSFLIL
ncbi:MAG: phosphatidate cytidylyltransferase [Promethearchaeota archaeon]